METANIFISDSLQTMLVMPSEPIDHPHLQNLALQALSRDGPNKVRPAFR